MSVSKLLFNEHPLVVLPSLALAIGLNEAIFTQQIHYWLQRSDIVKDGSKWVYKTFEEWHKELPFLSTRTIQRMVKDLQDKNIIIVEKMSSDKNDRVNFYSINYAELENIAVGKNNDKMATSSRQSGVMDNDKMATSSRQNGVMDNDNLSQCNIVKSLTETTTETTTENIKNIKKVSADDEGEQIIKALEIQHKKLNPNFEIKARGKSVIEASRLVKLDRYSLNVILSVVNWIFTSKKGAFWVANIQSGQKLRDKFQQLFIQFKNDKALSIGAKADYIHTDFVPNEVSENF